jgi:hypothetical protein
MVPLVHSSSLAVLFIFTLFACRRPNRNCESGTHTRTPPRSGRTTRQGNFKCRVQPTSPPGVQFFVICMKKKSVKSPGSAKSRAAIFFNFKMKRRRRRRRGQPRQQDEQARGRPRRARGREALPVERRADASFHGQLALRPERAGVNVTVLPGTYQLGVSGCQHL